MAMVRTSTSSDAARMPGTSSGTSTCTEHAHGIGAEHARRRLDVRIDLLDERRHHQDDERHRRHQVGEDHAGQRAGELHLVQHRRERDAVGDRRHQERQQEQQHQQPLAGETRAAPAHRRPARRSGPRAAPPRRHDLDGDQQDRRAGTPSTPPRTSWSCSRRAARCRASACANELTSTAAIIRPMLRKKKHDQAQHGSARQARADARSRLIPCLR